MPDPSPANDPGIKPTDLRGILKYVPMFRDQVFVLAADGSLVAHESFQNVLLDIAVLRSLNIHVVLVHGIGQQMIDRAGERGIAISDAHGEGRTDAVTLGLAVEVAATVSMNVMQGLTRNGLRCAVTNGLRASELGLVKGDDQMFAGRVDKLDLPMIRRLLDDGSVPVVSPIVFNREGEPLRVNSDLIASELAIQLDASKLIYLTTQDGLRIDGEPVTNIPVAQLAAVLEKEPSSVPDRLMSKARHVVRTIEGGTPRVHILDGRVFGALLNEVFDTVGIGTMVYSNEYQSIRPAGPRDAHTVFTIMRSGVRNESLRYRDLASIEAEIGDFLIYEIDGSVVACARLSAFEGGAVIEIGSVYVQPFYQQKGVGRRMVEYACIEARKRGARRVIALTTQAAGFFKSVCGFSEGGVDDLPEPRRGEYAADGRNSRIFVKDLAEN